MDLTIGNMLTPLLRRGLVRLSGTLIYAPSHVNRLDEIIVSVDVSLARSAWAVFHSGKALDEIDTRKAVYTLLHYTVHGALPDVVDGSLSPEPETAGPGVEPGMEQENADELDQRLDEEDRNAQFENKELDALLDADKQEDVEIAPDSLQNVTLRRHQQQALHWMLRRESGEVPEGMASSYLFLLAKAWR